MNIEKNTTAILLAAGSSKRMGAENKLLSIINGMAMVEQSLQNIAKSNFANIIIVLGHEADKIAKLPTLENMQADGKATIIINEKYKEGMGTSLAKAVSALDDSCESCMVFLADMPFIKTSTINMILAEANNDAQIIRPIYNGEIGHPVLLKKNTFAKLKSLNADEGAKSFLNTGNNPVYTIKTDDSGVIKDLDEKEIIQEVQQSG